METIKQENLLSMDISTAFTQISYRVDGMEEPISHEEREGDFCIPNILFYGEKTKKWYAGYKALKKQEEEEGVLVKDWEQMWKKEEKVVIQKEIYKVKTLFVKLLALHIKNLDIGNQFARIVVTSDDKELLFEEMEGMLKKELKTKEFLFYRISHKTAFTAFALHQEECSGVRNVGLFEYYGDEIRYQYLGRTPAGDMLQVQTFSLSEELEQTKGEDKDEKFATMAVNIFYRHKTPIVYLTGDGFEGEWMEKTLKVLCHNRRAFVGQNLFTKGAFYFAVEEGEKRNPKLLAQGLCLYDIGLAVTIKGQQSFAPVLGGGCDWYGRKNSAQMMLEEGKQIEVIYQNLRTKELEKEIMELHGMPKRPPMTTKIEMEIAYTSDCEGYIKIKDLGFGELYPSSHQIWVRKFSLDS